MRVKPLLLAAACALALGGCANSNTNQTANVPAPSPGAEQTTTPGQPNASPQAPGAPQQQTAVLPTAPARGNSDACALLTSDEIKAVQGEAVKESTPSQRGEASFAVAQCFYTTPTFTKSISLELTQRAANAKTSPRDFWEEHFGRYEKAGGREGKSEREREREREREQEKRRGGREEEEEEAEGTPPTPVSGIGDEAFWVNSRVSGALYVLQGDRFIRISLGGADDDATRQKKAKTLAQKVLPRL